MTRDDIIRLSLMGERTVKQRIEWAINMEREACAKVCDDLDGTFFKRRAVKLDKQQYGATDILKIMRDVNAMVTEDCADAIRARGQV